MGKKKTQKFVDWVAEQKPAPKQVEKIVKRTLGSSHWKPSKKGKRQ